MIHYNASSSSKFITYAAINVLTVNDTLPLWPRNHVHEFVWLNAWAITLSCVSKAVARLEWNGSSTLQQIFSRNLISDNCQVKRWHLPTVQKCSTWSSITAKGVATAWLDVLDRPPWVQLPFQQGLPEHVQVSLGWSSECTIMTSPTATWEGPKLWRWDSRSSCLQRFQNRSFVCTIILVRVLGSISKFSLSGLQQRLGSKSSCQREKVVSEVHQDHLQTCTTNNTSKQLVTSETYLTNELSEASVSWLD